MTVFVNPVLFCLSSGHTWDIWLRVTPYGNISYKHRTKQCPIKFWYPSKMVACDKHTLDGLKTLSNFYANNFTAQTRTVLFSHWEHSKFKSPQLMTVGCFLRQLLFGHVCQAWPASIKAKKHSLNLWLV